ncbi:MAG: AraC family transcriptional regulator [bacterium]|nr:AraC family transcriptional regulator [bacterium]
MTPSRLPQQPRRVLSYVKGDVELYSFGRLMDTLLPLDVCLVGRSVWSPGEHFERAGMFEWGVELVTSGCGVLTARGRTYELCPGDVFFFRPYEHVSYATAPHAHRWEKIFIDFFPGGVSLLMHQLGLAETTFLRLSTARLPRARSLFHRCLTLARARRPGCRSALSLTAYQLLLLLSHEVLAPTHREPIPDPVARVISYIEQHPERDLSAPQLSSIAGCSVRQLNRFFHRITGMSSHTWIEHAKMQRACLLLTHRADPISVISRQLGYHDPLYFSKVFKRITGRSPRDFRKFLVEPSPP